MALVATAAAAAQSEPLVGLKSPSRAEIARASGPIVDTTIRKRTLSGFAPAGYWGGVYTVSTGETVTVYASNSYPMDPALEQRWANFLASLIHGSELSQVTVLLSTPAQISQVCGEDAVACYSPQGSLLYTPGEDPASDLSAEAVITHEYGHHIAANRSNAPWVALDTGPKRWASMLQVCAKARRNELVPGAEDPVHYMLNPGEGWAETYRVLNERKAGLTETPWQIVTQALYPTDADLAAAQQDVVSPWERSTTTRQTAALRRTTRTRTFMVSTQLDGTLKLALRPTSGLRLAVNIYASSTRVAHAVTSSSLSRTTTVCGTRSYRIRVQALKGRGNVRLSVTKP